MNGPDYTVSDIWRKAILSSGAYPEFDHLKPHALDDLCAGCLHPTRGEHWAGCPELGPFYMDVGE